MVAVLVIASVAIPAITDVQSKDADLYNNGTTFSYHADLGDEFSMTKASNETAINVNGVDYVARSIDNYILLTKEVCILYTSSSQIDVIWDSGHSLVAVTDSFTASINGDVLTYAINGTSSTIPGISNGYVISETGDYIVANLGSVSIKTYVNDVSQISFGVFSSTLNDSVIYVDGVNQFSDVDVDVTLVPVDGYLNLYTVSNSNVIAEKGEFSQTIGYAIVPSEVTAIKDTPRNSLISVIIPVLLLIPIMIVIRMISGRGE